MERVRDNKGKRMIRKGKRRTTMTVASDEKRVGYRCSDEIGGSEDEVAVEEMKGRGSDGRMKEEWWRMK
jgi:hypothetical protein